MMGSLLSTVGMPQRKTVDPEIIKQELPEIFERRPEEVDDYIRPDKTYFESLEDLWDWVIGFMSPIEKQMQWMRSAHNGGFFGMDLSYGTVFLVWGVCMRLLSLIPMLYGHRNTLRMARCSTQTAEITNNIKRIKGDKSLTTPERRVMQDGYKRMEKAVYKKHKCSKYGSFVVGITTPVLVTSFMAIRRLAAYEDDLESATFLWIKDLTMPDPTMVLPLCCSCLFLMNFEMNQKLNRGGRSATALYLRWAVRVGALGFSYFCASQPSCLFAYWIGMSTAGMLQPLLLRNAKFRAYFDFPEQSKTAILHDEMSLTALIKSKIWKSEAPAKPVEKPITYESINDQDVIIEDEPVKPKSST